MEMYLECYQKIPIKNSEIMKIVYVSHHSLCWYCELNDYIGWSVCNAKDGKYLPKGLFCGYNNNSMSNNIFRKNKLKYKSNNENYKKRLPGWKNGDIIVLSYDSDLNRLSFAKTNDNGKLDSYIYNLPKVLTFYWFVGHHYKKMCLSIVD